MATKKKISDRGQGEELLSAFGLDGIYGRESFKTFAAEPRNLSQVQERCRKYAVESLFLQAGLFLKIGFANWGCKLVPVEKKDREKLDAWLEKNEGEKEGIIGDFIDEVWKDRYTVDAVVSFWRTPAGSKSLKVTEGQSRAFTLPAEDCNYSDDLGIETLKVRIQLSPEALKKMSEAEKKRYANGKEVELDEAYGEHYRVLKFARVGKGFGVPRMRALFTTVQASESLEVFDNLWGFVCRLAVRHVKIGHEIKSGPLAGLPKNFYKEEVAQNIRKMLEGRQGMLDYVGNFDQSFEFPFPSLDRFDKKKFEGVFQRMAYWLGPIGMLLMGMRGVEDVLMRMLRAEIRADRKKVGLYLNAVINEAFRPPVPVRVKWNDRVFMDSRQVMEMAKFLLQQGALSQRSGLESIGEDQTEEWDNKDEEAKQLNAEAKRHRILPPFDPAHGTSPGEAGPGAAGGRPAGQRSKGTG